MIQKFGPEVEVEETQNQTLGTEPATEKNQNVDSSLESEKEESSSKASGTSKEPPQSILKYQKKVQVGEATYVKPDRQSASAELRTKLQQHSKDLKGGSAIFEKKSAAQPIGRFITAIMAAKISEKSQLPSSSITEKGEVGRKKKEKRPQRRMVKQLLLRSSVQKWGVTPLSQTINDPFLLEY